jgi:2-iminobutanoate/2-iminopropanoate deaminase
MKQSIATPNAPAAIGPYSQAISTGALVFCSGQIPINPATGDIEAEGAAAQAEQVISNIEAILAATGLGLANVVKTTVFLADMADFATVNEVYAARFDTDPLPARSTFQVTALPKGALVEIEATALR